MERRGVLTGDSLRFDGAGLGGGALRRLDAASTRIAPLEIAQRGLAALTRVRLADLTSLARGDGALADVLARLVRTAGADDRGLDAPAPRRLGVPVSLTQPARVVPVSVERPEPIAVRVAGRVESNGRGLRFAPPALLASRRPTKASVSESQPGRAFLPVSAAEAPTPPRGFEVADGVRGLEWLVVRLPGGTESSETPLVDGAPEVSPARPARAADEPATAARALPVPDHAAPVPHEIEQVPETRRAVQPLLPTTAGDASHRRLGGAQGLDALVRAWQDTQPPLAPEQVKPPAEPVMPLPASRGPVRAAGAGRSRPAETQASQREEETLVFGDALGRVLVAELRRYGIEVEAG